MQDFGTSITCSLVATRGAAERTARAIRQLIGPRGRSIALATLAISPFATPAAAQSGSEAVVCAGSERRTLASNPMRRVYTEDMEIVYRIGADIGQRDQVECDLSSELGSYPEVWCAWSDSGDGHAVIVSWRHPPGPDRGPRGSRPSGTGRAGHRLEDQPAQATSESATDLVIC